jgi:hypothetical protein
MSSFGIILFLTGESETSTESNMASMEFSFAAFSLQADNIISKQKNMMYFNSV